MTVLLRLLLVAYRAPATEQLAKNLKRKDDIIKHQNVQLKEQSQDIIAALLYPLKRFQCTDSRIGKKPQEASTSSSELWRQTAVVSQGGLFQNTPSH